jgi:hypothetical protein
MGRLRKKHALKELQEEMVDQTMVLKIEDGREFVSVLKGIIKKNLK